MANKLGCLIVIVVRMGGLAGYGFEKSSLQLGLGLHVTHKEREGWVMGEEKAT